MDYSMLLGIYYMKITYNRAGNERCNSTEEEEVKYNEYLSNESDIYGGVRASVIEGPGIYYFGIIDAIQKYTFKKKLETCFRKWVQRKNVKGISCVDPVLYRKRFMKYMKSIIISDAQYYKQINLSTNRFGDENVLIYPPRKLLYQNMNSMRQKRTMTFVGGYTENVTMYDPIITEHTINSENEEENSLEQTPLPMSNGSNIENEILNDLQPSKLKKRFAKELKETLLKQNSK